MANCYLFFAFFFCANLFSTLLAKSGNVSAIPEEKDKNVTHTITPSSEKIQSLGSNKSYYENECNCGYYSYGCKYSVFGYKICDCYTGYAPNYDYCEECLCGSYSKECNYIDGKKTCKCQQGYSQNNGRCEECDCGEGSIKCSFEDDKKICSCKYTYAQKGDTCADCDCGSNSYGSKCFFENDEKICSCFNGYKQDINGQCELCDCGRNSLSCKFQGYSKVCTCKENYLYVDASGECEMCYCGPQTASCFFTYSGRWARCTCQPGYVPVRDKWEMDEECKLPGPSGWKIATYIVSAIFSLILLVSFCICCIKRN